MVALINNADKASSNLPNNLDGGNFKLLKQKIKDCITGCESIVVSISTPLVNCLDTIEVDDCEITEDSLCLNDGNFELHINFDNTTLITHEEDINEHFTITKNDSELNLYFI